MTCWLRLSRPSPAPSLSAHSFPAPLRCARGPAGKARTRDGSPAEASRSAAARRGYLSLAPPSGQEPGAAPLRLGVRRTVLLGSGFLRENSEGFSRTLRGEAGGSAEHRPAGCRWGPVAQVGLPLPLAKSALSPASLPSALVCCPGWEQVGPECPLGELLSPGRGCPGRAPTALRPEFGTARRGGGKGRAGTRARRGSFCPGNAPPGRERWPLC